MASSRKPPRRNESVGAALGQALAALLVAQPPAASTQPGLRLGVALSGGADSVVLLHALVHAAEHHAAPLSLHAIHIHHGLNRNADAWAAHCADLCAAWQVPLAVERVSVRDGHERGIEEAARLARYAALRERCRAEGIATLALAQHADDQAETVLLQLLRGAGPAGLSAMPVLRKDQGLALWRPLLGVTRAAIEAYAAEHGLTYVEDDSNRDIRYARNALRSQVLPELARHFPGYRETLGRFARLAADAQSVLADVAAGDLAAVRETHPALGESLRLSRWLDLSAARRGLALRAWLAEHGLRAPSEARLAQMAEQLGRGAPDAGVLLRHEGRAVRRYRDWIVLAADLAGAEASDDPAAGTSLVWSGEERLAVPLFGGSLLLQPTEGEGVPADWLRGAPLALRPRRSRERLRLAANRPSRSLKNLYQERGIPAWERDRLPVLWAGDSLVFAAGLGTDVRFLERTGGPRVRLGWEGGEPPAALG
jgi:tRNA(Ile)-lysidine synthase